MTVRRYGAGVSATGTEPRPTHRTIETSRLRLAPLGAAAIEALLQGASGRVADLTGLVWPDEPPPTLLPHLPLIRDRLEGGDDPHWWIWSVAGRDDPVALGAVGFSGPPDEHGLAWVGYALYPEHRRSGYATEAVRAVIDRAFEEPALRAVLATIAPDNDASRALARRVGMRFHGVGGRMTVYRVTRRQWEGAAG